MGGGGGVGVGGGGGAFNLGAAYGGGVAAHQAELQHLCVDAGFGLTVHHTDQPPATALMALHMMLAA